MAFRPNYSQQRGDRERAKQQKRQERLQRRAEGSEKRKAEREAVLGPEKEATTSASGKDPE